MYESCDNDMVYGIFIPFLHSGIKRITMGKVQGKVGQS